jgi:predicted metal-binding protein
MCNNGICNEYRTYRRLKCCKSHEKNEVIGSVILCLFMDDPTIPLVRKLVTEIWKEMDKKIKF